MFSEHTWDDQQLCTLAVLEDLSRGWSRSTSFQNLKIYSHQESFVPFYFWFLPGGVHDGRKCKEEQVDWDLERRGRASDHHLCQPEEGCWCPGQGSGEGNTYIHISVQDHITISNRWVTMRLHCTEERDRSRENLHWGNCLWFVQLSAITVDCSGLKEGGKDILVATDVAGRGTIQWNTVLSKV